MLRGKNPASPTITSNTAAREKTRRLERTSHRRNIGQYMQRLAEGDREQTEGMGKEFEARCFVVVFRALLAANTAVSLRARRFPVSSAGAFERLL